MAKLSEIPADKRFNAAIFNHEIFKNSSNIEIKKVFPEIGLENFSEDIAIDNSKEIILAANDLIKAISDEISHRLKTLSRYAEIKSNSENDKKPMGESRKVKYLKCKEVLNSFNAALSKKDIIVFNKTTGKTSLNLSENITENGLVQFKAGEGIFKVYQKINLLLKDGLFLPLSNLDVFPTFKIFSTVNVPANKSKIVFSSTGIDGAWDIATMSMRGITSCQQWTSTNSSSLVGSLVDPFTAIMYLTSGSEVPGGFGSKMIRRSIVRFAIDSEFNEPVLVLERMYPDANQEIANQFIKLLKDRTKNKIKIFNCSKEFRKGVKNLFIPFVPITSKLASHSLPYRDSSIPFKNALGNNIVEYKKELRLEFNNIIFSHKIVKALDSIKKKDLKSFAEKDLKYWKNVISITSDYSTITNCEISIRNKMNLILDKNISDLTKINVPLKIMAFSVLENCFDDKSCQAIIDEGMSKLLSVKDDIKPSVTLQKILRKKLSDSLNDLIQKEKLKMFKCCSKIKNKVSSSVLPELILDLIKKVS